jgi:sec-independent protein translocase protein TatA
MDIGWPEIAIIAVVILVLFGSKKLPDAARSLGRSMRILKTEVKGLHEEEPTPPAEIAAAPATSTQPAPTETVAAGEPKSTP